MARDLIDTEYYISHGGKIPIKWTAPEVSSYFLKLENLLLMKLYESLVYIIGNLLQEVLHCQ